MATTSTRSDGNPVHRWSPWSEHGLRWQMTGAEHNHTRTTRVNNGSRKALRTMAASATGWQPVRAPIWVRIPEVSKQTAGGRDQLIGLAWPDTECRCPSPAMIGMKQGARWAVGPRTALGPAPLRAEGILPARLVPQVLFLGRTQIPALHQVGPGILSNPTSHEFGTEVHDRITGTRFGRSRRPWGGWNYSPAHRTVGFT